MFGLGWLCQGVTFFSSSRGGAPGMTQLHGKCAASVGIASRRDCSATTI